MATNRNYHLQILTGWCMELKPKIFSKNKEMFDFTNYFAKSKYYDDSNLGVVGKMKNKLSDVAIEELVGLKSKMCLTLVSSFCEYKKANDVNKSIPVKISHTEYEDSW